MAIQFITNDKGECTAAVVPITEYEDLLHQHHLTLELSDDYKKMIDGMLADEDAGNAEYVSLDEIKAQFQAGK